MQREQAEHHARKTIATHGADVILPGIGSWERVEAMMVKGFEELELPPDDGVGDDLQAFYRVTNIAREELVDQALSGNIARRHHLASAVDGFKMVGVLLEAEEIVKDIFEVDGDDEPSASQDASFHDAHDTTHDVG